jgi:superfamily II DNA or RNA helicase
MGEPIFTWFPTDDEPPIPPPRIWTPPDPDYDYTRDDPEPDADELSAMASGVSAVTLRDYQEKGVRKTYDEWERGRSRTMVVLPTGTGKTYLGAGAWSRYGEWAGPRRDGSPRRVLVVAPRDYLLEQWARSFVKMGMVPSISRGGFHRLDGGLWGSPTIVLSLIQSFHKRGRKPSLPGWPPDFFDAAIFDECHHVISPSHKDLLSHFRFRNILGLTATPDRMDGEDLGQVFDSIAYEYPLDKAMAKGWVCRIKVRWCDLKLDLRDLMKKVREGSDLNDKDLGELISPHVQKFARAIKQEVGRRKTIVFCPTVKIAMAMAVALNKLGISSESLDGTSQNRRHVIEGFEGDQYQVLCNCALFVEGFDVPDVECVVLMRPTKSRTLYYQMVGRGLRPKENPLIILDFPWVAGSHKLVKPVDLFKIDRFTQEQIDMASAFLDVGEIDDLMEAMKQADFVIRERRKLDVDVTDGKAKYRRVEFDPLSDVEVKELPPREEIDYGFVGATLSQVRILSDNGIPGADVMSRKQASAIINRIFERRRVIKELIAYGYDRGAAWKLSGSQAARELREIRARLQ